MFGAVPRVVLRGATCLAALAAGPICFGGEATAPATALPTKPGFTFAAVRERARLSAMREYRAEPNKLPDSLKKLGYDDYQVIRFRPEQGPWQADHLDFTFQFFHPGYLYQDPVFIHLVENGQVQDFNFSTRQFDYGRVHFPEALPADLHFDGLRVLYPLNDPHKQDEVATFIGASYFRMLGARQRYGASLRGLAIDTAEPSGEEFPLFTEFWIEKPAVHSHYLEVFALLDSPSVAGAYRFVIQPGDTTLVAEEASLFLRKEIKKLGLAPLTSMFLEGENRTGYVPDFRPEVHDSDGLLLQMGNGQRLWRPLVNPQRNHRISRFAMNNPTAFGLLQRDRDFGSYEDLAARFDLRPSLWVQPKGNWGTGAVELVEIPTPNEYHDNIVAYWVPQQKPVVGQEFRWSCTLSAFSNEPEGPALLTVQATRISPEHDKNPPRFVIDFSGGPLVPAPNAALEAKLEASRGDIKNLVLQPNDVTGGWRLFFDLTGEWGDETDLRAFLHSGSQALSETWVYRYQKP